MKKKIKQFEKDGYFIVENALTEDEALEFRQLCDDYFENYPVFHAKGAHGGGGFAACGFAGQTPALGVLNNFHQDSRLQELAKLTLGSDDFVYTQHSDLHQDIITPWHRDFRDYMNGSTTEKPRAGSHKKNVLGEERNIRSSPVDFIVFDHRIMHRGAVRQFRDEYSQSRCLLAWGFGLDNKYTQQFTVGCVERQEHAKTKMKLKQEYLEQENI